jgi:hypothetical protein
MVPYVGPIIQGTDRLCNLVRECGIAGLEGMSPLGEIPVTTTPRVLTYSTRDVIDKRISVPAQHSLVRLSKNSAASADAVGMLEEVKAARLAGIYCVNWKLPAQRALRFGKYWWTVIPQSEDAVLMLDPDNPASGQPLIAFRRELDPRDKYGCGKLKTDKTWTPFLARLDAALVKAWAAYRLWQSGQLPKLSQCALPTSGNGILAGSPIYALSEADPLCNLITIIIGAPKASSLPPGLKLLAHFHVRKHIPTGVTEPAFMEMNPEGMNPGFLDLAGNAPVVDRTPKGLQSLLEDLIKTKYGRLKDKIAVTLVDLTGKKRFAPEFAGWRESVPMNGASVPKICALYTVHQLRFDLEVLAITRQVNSADNLIQLAKLEWQKKGLKPAQWPKVSELFIIGGNPLSVVLKPEIRDLLCCIFANNSNRSAAVLVRKLGFSYIASVLWQSGLFNPSRSGLWLSTEYPTTRDGKVCKRNDNKVECDTFRMPSPSQPVIVRTSPLTTGLNVTALSAAVFFTLMAQGRLVNDKISLEILKELQPACTFFGGGQLTCSKFRPPSKCGCSALGCNGGNVHDVILIERDVKASSPRCESTGKVIRYVAVLLTAGATGLKAEAEKLFEQFLIDLDALIQQKNPGMAIGR